MRCCFAAAAVALVAILLTAGDGAGRPLDGLYAKKTEVLSEGWTVTKRFRGGERASVQVIRLGGDSYVETTVSVKIYDEKNNLVAEDRGRQVPAKDMVAVFWYPPRDAAYRIEVRNAESIPTRYFVAIR
jgi:hypothetical protein